MLQENFMTSMIKADGNLLAFFDRPIGAVLGVITILIWCTDENQPARRRRHAVRDRHTGGAAG
jgi:putative tricarboxylic transport membrane protein